MIDKLISKINAWSSDYSVRYEINTNGFLDLYVKEGRSLYTDGDKLKEIKVLKGRATTYTQHFLEGFFSCLATKHDF